MTAADAAAGRPAVVPAAALADVLPPELSGLAGSALLEALHARYGAPQVRSEEGGVRELAFTLPDRQLVVRQLAGSLELVSAASLFSALCMVAKPPAIVVAAGTGTATFIPGFGAAAATAAAVLAAGIAANAALGPLVKAACVGCSPPCTCVDIMLLPPPPAIAIAVLRTILGIPVVFQVTATVTLRSLVMCV